MINWQFFPDSAPAVCEAYGNLPTVAIDMPEEPCQATFVGAEQPRSGPGRGHGSRRVRQGAVRLRVRRLHLARLPHHPGHQRRARRWQQGGLREHLRAIPADKYFSLDTFAGGPDQPENSRRQVTDMLTIAARCQDHPDHLARRRLDARRRAGCGRCRRVARTRSGSWDTALTRASSTLIRNEPQWVGDVAYFPERYGALIMPLAIALAKGEAVPEEVLVTHEFINARQHRRVLPGRVTGASPDRRRAGPACGPARTMTGREPRRPIGAC